MKAIPLLLLALCLSGWAWTQDPAYPTAPTTPNLVQAEYFFDTDPGFGAATPITITPGTNIANVAASVNTAGLAGGIHRIGLRTRAANGWSVTAIADFLVDFNPAYPTPAPLSNITEAEYVLDTNTPFGGGTPVTITPATDLVNVPVVVNTAGLSIGIHRVYLRTRAANGWSLTAQKDFLVDENPAYPTPPAAPGNLVYAEYFFDTDPGFGAGTPITFTPTVNLTDVVVPVNTASLPDGVHRLYLRALDDWSLTAYQSFLKGNPLPLRLLSFSARKADRGVALNWQTETEVNTSHFDVERSADGRRFEKIGTVTAANAAGRQAYALDDAQPLDGKSFYRLKQVDRDGRFEYSAMVLINRGKGLELQLFPNPAQTLLRITVPQQTAPRQLQLINANAQVLKTLTVAAGAGSLELSVADLAPGQYFIKWQSGNDVLVKRFVKQ